MLLSGCGGTDPAKPCSVELNGDSIMSGLRIDKFAKTLGTLRPGMVFVDKAVEGLSLKAVYEGYTMPFPGAPIPPFGPQPPFKQVKRTSSVILIELGGNDAYGNIDPVLYTTMLEDMIQIVMTEGRVPVLTGIVDVVPGYTFDVPTRDRITVLNNIMQATATKYGLVFVDWRQVPFNGLSDTIGDGVHRTQDNATLLAIRTASALDQACKR